MIRAGWALLARADGSSGQQRFHAIHGEAAKSFVDIVRGNMLDADPPEHTRLRQLVRKAFTPRRVENLRPRVQQITDELLAAIAPHSEADLIETLAFPLPVTVICELLGLPMSDRAEFRSWTADWASSLDPAADREPIRRAGVALRAYFENLIAGIQLDDVPEDEQPDLTRALLRATDEGASSAATS